MTARYTDADQRNAAADVDSEFEVAVIHLLDRIALALERGNDLQASHPSRV